MTTSNKTKTIVAPSFNASNSSGRAQSAPRYQNPNTTNEWFEDLSGPTTYVFVGRQNKIDGSPIQSAAGNGKFRFMHVPMVQVKVGNAPQRWEKRTPVYTDVWLKPDDMTGVFPGQTMEILAGAVKHETFIANKGLPNETAYPQRTFVKLVNCVPVGDIITEKQYLKNLKAKAKLAGKTSLVAQAAKATKSKKAKTATPPFTPEPVIVVSDEQITA